MSSVDNKDPQQQPSGNSGTKKQKVVSTIVNVLIYAFCVLCVVLLVIAIVSKKNADDTVKIFGYEMRIVTSGSMEKNEKTYNDIKKFKIKSIKTGSVLLIQTVPQDEAKADEWYSKLQPGDVLTFKYVPANKQVTITHRIVDIQPKEDGGYLISLKGDNDEDIQTIDTKPNENDVTKRYNYVIGKVVSKNYLFGYFITQLKTPVGLALIIIVPCFILIVLQAINIANIVNENKRKQVEEQAQQQLDEMDELKRRIAELEGLTSDEDAKESENNKDNE